MEPDAGPPATHDRAAVPRPLDVVIRREWTTVGAPPAESDDVVTFSHPAATVADLASALGLGEEDTVLIDGAPAARRLPLLATEVHRGSVITIRAAGAPAERCHDAPASPGVDARFRTVHGPDAGVEVALGPGSYLLGSDADADLRVGDPLIARRHAYFEIDERGGVTVADLAPARPSRIRDAAVEVATRLREGDVLEVGGSGIELMPAERDTEPARPSPAVACRSADWTRPLHRPPRTAARPPVPPVTPPAATSALGAGTPFGLAAVIATLVGSAVVALVVHQPAFLLLGAVGAVGTIAAALWQRGRQRSTRRSAGRAAQAELDRFHAALVAHRTEVAARLRLETTELADAVDWARRGSPAIWGRRADDPGAFQAVVGRGDRVLPPAIVGDVMALTQEAWVLWEAASVLSDVPATIGLGAGAVVGVVGSPLSAHALARGLVVQVAVAHGPADLVVAALCSEERLDKGGWLRWLPQVRESSGGDVLVADPSEAADLMALVEQGTITPGAHLLVVVDDPSLLAARNSPARRLLAREDRSAAALVVAGSARELPSVCTTVVEVADDGTGRIHRPGSAEFADRVRVAGASAATARHVALALAALHDPEQPATTAGLPRDVALTALLDVEVGDTGALAAAWSAAGDDPPPRTLLAVASDGAVEIDLVRDGPHALIAGTTGSGKSELLRSLIVGLAMHAPPDQLSFVLVDYKGGAAFDACARLPHVAGLVTDLDERLAERALRSLHAELLRRERILREAGVADLTAYRAQIGRPPLGRLVVVVDEFATLAADLPDFITSLVGIAQRGRSLGVHLVLATQRPAGAVSDDIRANTNLRIALRVQDVSDSVDVIGDPAAASLPRRHPGRALVRLGPGELVPVQVAAATVPVPTVDRPVISVRAAGSGQQGAEADGGESILGVLVETARRAAGLAGAAVTHRPWMQPLPADIPWEDLPAGTVGVLDDPDRQAQEPWVWDPTIGHLLCVGAVGAGVSTALASVVLAYASANPTSAIHVYVLHGGSTLTALAGLPHVGASISPADEERQARVLRLLAATIDERVRGFVDGSSSATVLLVVDQLATWRTSVADRLGPELADLLDRILVQGPSVGVVVAGGLDRPGALPVSVSGAVGERLVFRLADPGDAAVVGVRPVQVSGLEPGRAIVATSGLELQVARPADIEAAVGGIARRDGVGTRVAPPVAVLPTVLPISDLPSVSRSGRPWALPIGLADATLAPAVLVLHPRDHVVVAGPARSGKSSALVLLATQIRRAAAGVRLVSIAPRSSPLHLADVDARLPNASELASALRGADGPAVVLVDDAELVEDPEQVLAGLAGGARGDVHVIAAGRVETLRAAYGHWTQAVRRARRGLILQPQGDSDGDVLSTLLPRREAAPPARGRGYLVADGACAFVQLAHVDRREQEAAD
jgi:DNA segregation ATPase FtsK/SpoIIIE, S-DNA-T family